MKMTDSTENQEDQTPREFCREWERFHGLTEAECAEAEALIGELQRRDFRWVRVLDAEKRPLACGEYTRSSWFSLTTNQCCHAKIRYMATAEVQPERLVAA